MKNLETKIIKWNEVEVNQAIKLEFKEEENEGYVDLTNSCKGSKEVVLKNKNYIRELSMCSMTNK